MKSSQFRCKIYGFDLDDENTNVLELKSINILNYIDDKYKTQAIKKIPIIYITRALLKALDTLLQPILDKYTLDIILIENQPVTMNPKMKTIQMHVNSSIVVIF